MRTLVATVLAVVLLSACQTDVTQKPSIRIINRTAGSIVLSYDEPGRHRDLGMVEPGRISTVESVFAEFGAGCHGPFVARRADGTEIARLDRACSGMDWSVQGPASSWHGPSRFATATLIATTRGQV